MHGLLSSRSWKIFLNYALAHFGETSTLHIEMGYDSRGSESGMPRDGP